MSVNEDFHTDARPLVAGSITGVRSFRVDKLGRLTGVTHKKVWRPGVNTAACPHVPIKAKASAEDLDAATEAVRTFGQSTPDPYVYTLRSMVTASGMSWHTTGRKKVDKDHRPGGSGCDCGFWAYFDGSDDFSSDSTLTAIVEAQGVVTVGSKGFRAEKAEIVALVDPSGRWQEDKPEADAKPSLWDRWSDWIYKERYDTGGNIVVTSLMLATAGALLVGFSDVGLWAPLLAIGLSIFALVGWRVRDRGIDHGRKRAERTMHKAFASGMTLSWRLSGEEPTKPLDAEQWQAVRRNYPDVKVYPNLKAALRAHPLTEPPKPEPITPDNTPDFWERPA